MADEIPLRPAGVAVAQLGARKSANHAPLMLLQSVRINGKAIP
jgi:hypothetical protein